jgi:serine/threonine protein kinase
MSEHGTISALSSLKSIENERKRDTLGARIKTIQELLRGKTLKPLIDFDKTKINDFIHGNEDDTVMSNSDIGSNDTRNTLHKRVYKFNDIIKQIGGMLRYIKSGTTGHTFRGEIVCETGLKYDYAVKVVAYPKKSKYGVIHDSARPENAEIMMLRVLSFFIVTKKTQHIVLPIATFNTNIKPFLNLVNDKVVDESDKKYMEFLSAYCDGGFHEEVSILLSEWANKGDLLDYVRNNYKKMTTLEWKVIFFQIISVLAIIQYTFPSFRHNDMKANNILLHEISKEKKQHTYHVCKKKYEIPNIGLSIKLWDFDFACIPGIVDNIKVRLEWTKQINVTPKEHKYYDIHYFFNTLIEFFEPLLNSRYVDDEVKNFVKFVVPQKYRTVHCKHGKAKDGGCKMCHKIVQHKGRLLVSDEYLTPVKILNHEFFSQFVAK